MKRDLDLIREILLKLEDSLDATISSSSELVIEDYTADEVSYHVRLLHEAGLIDGHHGSFGSRFVLLNVRPTWDGYEFLAVSKSSKMWEKAKKVLVDESVGLVYAILLQWLKAEIFGQA